MNAEAERPASGEWAATAPAGCTFPGSMVAMATVTVLGLLPSCVVPTRMCASEPDCLARSACVAGRCLPQGGVASIATARRVLFSPVDVAFVSPSGGTRQAIAGSEAPNAQGSTIATLGKGDGALALFRFSIPLPADSLVLEAYLLLPRATDVDVDPDLVSLRAARILEPWESRGRSLTWAHQPRLRDVGAPATRLWGIVGASGPWVRLDVRVIVQRWLRHPSDEFGIAVLAEGHSATGVTLALEPAAGLGGHGGRGRRGGGEVGGTGEVVGVFADAEVLGVGGPELELYVK